MIFTEAEVFDSSSREESSPLKSFYNESLRHTLILQDESCLLWSHSSSSSSSSSSQYAHQKINVFYKDSIFASCIFIKVSLDFVFIACQVSNTQVVVIDKLQNQRYTINIKSQSSTTVVPNQLLLNGILWSNHRGGSQDLILITTFGLEIYKVSSTRRQCKLSRHLSEYATHAVIESFWYNPSSRLLIPLFIPTPTNISSRGLLNYLSRSLTITSPIVAAESGDQHHFYIGYYLNQDTPSIPALELPPPEKMPNILRFGKQQVGCELKLFSLYSVSYCAVLYLISDCYYLGLFHITKMGILQYYYLLLFPKAADGVVSKVPQVEVSVVDNLLVVHLSLIKTSLLFDLRDEKCKSATNKMLPAMVGDEPIQIIEPICEIPVVLDLSSPRSLSVDAENSFAVNGEILPPICWEYASTNEFSHTYCYPNQLLLTSSSFCISLTFQVDPRKVSNMILAAEHDSTTSGGEEQVNLGRVVQFLLRRGISKVDDPEMEQKSRHALLDVLLESGKCKLSVPYFRSPFEIISSLTSTSCVPAAPIDQDLVTTFATLSVDSANSSADFMAASLPSQSLRTADGDWMVIEQTELLRHVFLPLCLYHLTNNQLQISSELSSGQVIQSGPKYMCALLLEFMSTLRSVSVDDVSSAAKIVDPALSLLLFHMLIRCDLYVDLISSFQAQLFTDSVELALTILAKADLLQEKNMLTNLRMSLSVLQARGVVAAFQQVGVDMLWRLKSTCALQHWLVYHNRIFDSIRMSTYLAGSGSIDKLSDIIPLDILVGEAHTILGLDAAIDTTKYNLESLFSLYLHLKS